MTVSELAARLRGESPLLSVGIATADPLRLGDAVAELKRAGVELVHLDVMDGIYCPPATTAAPALARALSPIVTVDVHLMVDEPMRHIPQWIEAGAGIVSFQLEGARHPHRVLQSMAGSGVVRGVALAPGTPVSNVEPLLGELEMVLLLGVNPGWGGQRFDEGTIARLRQMRELIGPRLLAVDGSIPRDGMIGRLQDADIVVTGSAVFDGDPYENASAMREQFGAR
jgi:ribulose-phosphate 3-epimerase